MTIRGTRARITPASLAIIMRRALEYPRNPRTKVAEDLQKELKKEHHDVPELEVLERKISNLRTHETNSELDKPWGISTLRDREIPPESLPVVLELFIEKLRADAVHITIREALWIGRLAFVVKDKKILWDTAISYAWAEKVFKDMGFETMDVDDDAMLYEDMTGKGFSYDDMSDIRKKESIAKVKEKNRKYQTKKG